MATIVEDFPHPIEEIENVWIPLPDGCRLAARIWRPADANENPVPAILEYLPYRKRDLMRLRDEPMHRYLAGHGYAGIRVDVRGSGDSGGVLHDEYSRDEIDDGGAIIAWLANQPWCSGAVGMIGISWGGFNSLQIAATRPEALKAIITLCAADDRYADDAHYMGGCLINENLQWGSVLMAYNALPPDPEIVGAAWREMWLNRLEHATAFPARWMEHQHRDDYWRHGSVSEDFSAIECPVYAMGGWADGYSNAIPRLLEHLNVPRKGLVGPWSHMFPHDGQPGPVIGFMQESVRWWDHWLKGVDTGLMDEPQYRVWMQDYVPPAPTYVERPGRWVAEERWPSPRIEQRRYHINANRLDTQPETPANLSICSPQTTGSTGGEWCAFGVDGEMPTDQRQDDGRSLVFDTDPLNMPLEILGAPAVTLQLSCDVPVGMVAVRLSDVAPDGASTRVTYGLLNLTHRDCHAVPEALVPGRSYQVRVPLNDIAHRFPAGHQIRVAISTSYWPIAWPAPENATLTLQTSDSILDLPIRPDRAEDTSLRAFDAPERGPGDDTVQVRPMRHIRELGRNLTTNELLHTLRNDGGEIGGASLARIEAIDLEVGRRMERRFRIGESDPLTARGDIVQDFMLRRPGWQVRVQVRVRLHSNAGNFLFNANLEAYENDDLVFSRHWDLTIPRDLV
ncbi:MAG: CocE/NonD family hydrolase [Proteobacteria bacterium]|nr:CocE/NonD family hydrolase [Pseudomonadota bacterium]